MTWKSANKMMSNTLCVAKQTHPRFERSLSQKSAFIAVHPVIPNRLRSRSSVASTSGTSGTCNPVHPDFCDLETRLATFGNNFEPKFADLGFFVEEQCLVCFSCGLTLDSVPKDLIVEHLVEKPTCEHARLIHTLVRMRKLSKRLESFKDHANLGEKFAKAGFFYRKEDGRIQCAYCRIIIKDWINIGDAFDEHARLALTCPFILNPPDYAFNDDNFEIETRSNFIKHRELCYPNMASPDARLRTFDGWTSVVDKELLVDAGFFSLKVTDFTKCFHCGGGLCSWRGDDDPWREHARWYPDCEYVRLVKGQEFVEACKVPVGVPSSDLLRQNSSEPALSAPLQMELDLLMDGDDVQRYQKRGVMRPKLRVGLRSFMVKNNRGFESPEELSDCLYSISQLGFPGNVESDEVRDELSCVVCMVEKRGAVFSPCCHMVTCYKCAASVTTCPVCRTKIDQVVRIYLS